MARARFELYDIVRVRESNPELAEIHGERGAILAIADREDGRREYGVFVYRDEMVWQLAEEDLEATGERTSREALYGDSAARVIVDGQGRGRAVDTEAPSGTSVVIATLGFVAALYIAWTGAWLLLPLLEHGLGWPATSADRTLYWTIMRAMLWVAPAALVFGYAQINVGEAMRGDGICPAVVWGSGAGLLIGATAVVEKVFSGGSFSLTLDSTFLSVVFIVPVVEELVFRGAVMGALMKRYRFAAANVLTSLLFVGAHVPGWHFLGVLGERLTQPVGGALSIFFLGLIFGYVVKRSRSIAAGMIAHGINNLFSVL